MKNPRRLLPFVVLSTALALVSTAHAFGPEEPGAVTPETLNLPSGPASVRGLSDAATVDAFAAQIRYSVPIDLPGAVRGFRPSLDLSYAGELGNGPVGIGWTLAVPQIRRSLRLGVPHYDPSDELELVGVPDGGRLVAVGDGAWRVQGKGQRVKVDRAGGGFRVTDAQGQVYLFGIDGGARQDGPSGTQTWFLQQVADLAGQTIALGYTRDQNELYPTSMTWGPQGGFRATLGYQTRDDAVVSWRRGFRVVTAQRLSEIRVETFGALSSLYRIKYDETLAVSRLASVTRFGRDGATALPTLTFHYSAPASPSRIVMGNTEGWSLGRGVSFLDVDGDGIADLLSTTSAGHKYKRNRAGTFAPARALTGDGATSYDLSHARLEDLFGDARPELVAQTAAGWLVYRLSGETWQQVGGAFPGSVNLPVLGGGAAHLDLDGDGRTDVLSVTANGLIFNQNGPAGLVPHPIPPIGGDATITPSRAGVRFCDVNGDGLDDAVVVEDQRFTFYIGHGDGTFDAGQIVGYPWSDVTSADNVLLGDLDRDGLIDLVRVTGGNVELYGGRPGVHFSPTARVLARPEPVDGDVVVALADGNGNGSVDVVWSSPRGMWALDLAGATSAGMLVGIDNGLCKSTTFAYDASGPLAIRAEDAGQPWLRTLPLSIPVPVSTTIAPGAGEPAQSVEYVVRDGFWDYAERRFGGFQTITRVLPGADGSPTRSEVVTYHLGLGADRVLRGVPLVERIYAGATLNRATFNTWIAGAIDGMPADPLLRKAERFQTRTEFYEGQGVGGKLVTVVDYTFDGQGRVTQESNQGRIDLTGDELVVTRSWASDDTLGVRDVLIGEEHRTPGGAVVSATRYFFGDDRNELPLGQVGRGWLRETQAWLSYAGEADRWITREQRSYDALGNLVAHTRGGITRHLTYDAHALHPLRETVGDAGSLLTWQMTWDEVLDKPISTIDPNGVTETVGYDAVGRPTSLAMNGAPPHVVYQYDWRAPRPRTDTFIFDGPVGQLAPFSGWQPGNGWRQSVTLTDGAGDPLVRATRLDATRWQVAGWRTRDSRGRVTVLSAPFVATGELPLMPDPAAAAQRLRYDALDRLIEQDSETGAQKHVYYAAFSTTEAVSDLAPVTRTSDGLGRVVHTQRAPWSGPDISGITESADAQYDVDNRLVSIAVASGRAIDRYSYDSLGRLRRADDPDIGPRDLAYDDNDRVVQRKNAAGDVTTLGYDGFGRPTTIQSGAQRFVYHYDSPKAGVNAGNTIGRLSWAEEPTGEAHLSYDGNGRVVWFRRVVEGLAGEQSATFAPSGLQLASTFDDGFRVDFAYDQAARLIGAGNYWRATQLDAAGRVTSEQYGNGAEEDYTRDAAGAVSRVTVRPAAGAAPLYDLQLTRTAGGFVTAVADLDGVGLDHDATFSYDRCGRLSDAVEGAWHFRYTYDLAQNMTARSAAGPRDLGLLTGTYGYGEGGAGPRQLTSVTAATGIKTTFAYDGAGRQTRSGAAGYQWDGFDRLLAVTGSGGTVASYNYGYDGLRVASHDAAGHAQHWLTSDLVDRDGKREHYVRIGSRTVARVAALRSPPPMGSSASLMLLPIGLLSGLAMSRQRRRVAAWLAALLVGLIAQSACVAPSAMGTSAALAPTTSEEIYFHRGLGDAPALLTGARAVVVDERRWEPFGQPIDANLAIDPLNDLNQESDAATGLSYQGARWMAPVTGRWLTPDALSKAPNASLMAAPWKLHPYQYVMQNPVSFWDPDGNDALDKIVETWAAIAPLGIAGWVVNPDKAAEETIKLVEQVITIGAPENTVTTIDETGGRAGGHGEPALTDGEALGQIAINAAASAAVGKGVEIAADLPILDPAPAPALASGPPNLAEVNPNVGVKPGFSRQINCVNCAICTDATLAGSPATALPVDRPLGISDIESAFGKTRNDWVSHSDWQSIEAHLASEGPGARGITLIDRSPNVGHAVNGANIDGNVHFLDGQRDGAAIQESNVQLWFLRTDK